MSLDNAILWSPSSEQIENSQMAQFKKFYEGFKAQSFADYETFCDSTIESFPDFWSAYLNFSKILYQGSLSPALLPSDKFYLNEFFPKLQLSYAENLFSQMSNDAEVMVGLTELEGLRRVWNKQQIQKAIVSLQKILIKAGVSKGDRVAALLPNSPETVLAMMAVTGLGAIWSSCSPDFGEQGVLDRFLQIDPKFLFVADEVIYASKRFSLQSKNDFVISKLSGLKGTHVFSHLNSDLEMALGVPKFLAEQDSQVLPIFEKVPFRHPLFVMFSSGTTGQPKCIVHGTGGTLLQHKKELQLHCDLNPKEKILYYTTCGWMMWNWVTSALSVGTTLYCYDGSPAAPKSDSLWNIVDREKIEVFGTSAKFLGACRNQQLDLASQYKLSQLRLVLSTGSPLLPEDFDYFYSSSLDASKRVQLASICGGTDIVSCFMLGNPLKPVRRGEIQARGLGMDVRAFAADGFSIRDDQGELVCATPFPSMPVSFANDPEYKMYEKSYFSVFPNVWHHGDFISFTQKGGIVVYGRSDATLNPSGVRIGTAEIYRQVETHPLVADSLAVGRKTKDDEEVILFVKLKDKAQQLDDEIKKDIRQRIRKGASPRHVPAEIYLVDEIPYTVSGKKVEIAVKRILHAQDPGNREALINPDVLKLYESFPKGAT